MNQKKKKNGIIHCLNLNTTISILILQQDSKNSTRFDSLVEVA